MSPGDLHARFQHAVAALAASSSDTAMNRRELLFLTIALRLLEEEKSFVKGSSLQVRCLRGSSTVLLSDPFVISLQCVGGGYMGASRKGNSKFSQHKPRNMTAAVKKKHCSGILWVFLAAGQIGAAQNYQKRGHFETPSREISDLSPGQERRPEAFLHNGGKIV